MVAQIEQEKNDFLHCHVLYVIQSENLSGKQLAGVYFNYALGLCLLIKTLAIKPKGGTNPGNLERNIEGNICEQVDFKLFTIF